MSSSNRSRQFGVLLAAVSSIVLLISSCAEDATDVAASSAPATAPTTAQQIEQPAAETTDAQRSTTPLPAQGAEPQNDPHGPREVEVDPANFKESNGNGAGYYFASPSGNVSCGIFPGGSPAGYIGCQAGQSVDPPNGPSCTNAENDKFAVKIEDGGAQHFCTTQGLYTSPIGTVLQYGQIIEVDGSYCVSRKEGVSCAVAGNNAFGMSRESNYTY